MVVCYGFELNFFEKKLPKNLVDMKMVLYLCSVLVRYYTKTLTRK